MENFCREDFELYNIVVSDDIFYCCGNHPDEYSVVKETANEIELVKNDGSHFVVLNKRWVLRTNYVRKKQD